MTDSRKGPVDSSTVMYRDIYSRACAMCFEGEVPKKAKNDEAKCSAVSKNEIRVQQLQTKYNRKLPAPVSEVFWHGPFLPQ